MLGKQHNVCSPLCDFLLACMDFDVMTLKLPTPTAYYEYFHHIFNVSVRLLPSFGAFAVKILFDIVTLTCDLQLWNLSIFHI